MAVKIDWILVVLGGLAALLFFRRNNSIQNPVEMAQQDLQDVAGDYHIAPVPDWLQNSPLSVQVPVLTMMTVNPPLKEDLLSLKAVVADDAGNWTQITPDAGMVSLLSGGLPEGTTLRSYLQYGTGNLQVNTLGTGYYVPPGYHLNDIIVMGADPAFGLPEGRQYWLHPDGV